MEAELTGFADFFRAEYETLLRAIYLISGSRDEAEELAQDAFVKACERWDRVREMENPAGYLYRTAVNKRRSVARRLRLVAQRTFSLRPPDVIAQSDDRDQIRRALALLPEGQREAIVLVEWLGLTDAEAGRVLEVSAGAVRVRILRRSGKSSTSSNATRDAVGSPARRVSVTRSVTRRGLGCADMPLTW